MVRELRLMAAVELHVNATYYAPRPALNEISQKQPLLFLVQDHFWVFWGNNSSKQCLIELKFWLQVVLMVAQMLLKAF